ncbi:MAG: putative Ig domain-containing protein [Planctomycetes bacterium]|nr:putative Ig domain-containing protein [Planctomycetota bacterium]
MRYLACAALLALLTVAGCDNDSGSSGGSSNPAPLTITTTTIPGFVVPGMPGPLPPYNATISATGGSGNYSWSVVSGTLPAGLTLAPTGTPDTTITGTLATIPYTSFTVQVTDSNFATATMTYTLVVTFAPTPPPEPPPVYFGQGAGGRTLFICDVSSATAGQPLANLQTELSASLASMSSSDEFDVMVFNSAISGYVTSMWGTPLPATSGNVAAATAWINGPNFTPAGSADNACYAALQASFATYAGIDNALLFTWTTPADASSILADYPIWAASDPGRGLTVICKNPSNASFGQQLAALAGGSFVP